MSAVVWKAKGQQATWDGQVPDGVTPLERDLFTTKDFYQDGALWSDPALLPLQQPVDAAGDVGRRPARRHAS